MDVLGRIVPLALMDTLSVSTLAIPVWFLLTPRGLRMANVFGYLLSVAAGYLLLGLAMLSALSAVREPLRSALDSPAGDMATAACGVVLILIGAWYGLLRREKEGQGRLTAWREAAVGSSATSRGLIVVALTAIALEVVTMFPYLAAIDALGGSGLPWAVQAAMLALYCLVMIAPAVLMAIGRAVSRRAVQPTLRRIDHWLRVNARENTAWLFALVGFLLLSGTSAYEKAMDLLTG
ncbi:MULTISPECIES: GAP family protein [unclassified Streptomyces]|uniref:GAP family protein n=1 Tax=unclassified Streptomyces TaxID=2593676 RepID=UPI0037F89938